MRPTSLPSRQTFSQSSRRGNLQALFKAVAIVAVGGVDFSVIGLRRGTTRGWTPPEPGNLSIYLAGDHLQRIPRL
jgi:hypothetical protein